MDKESQELVRLATEGGVDAFLKTVAAPLVEIGGWGADLVRRYRFKSAIRTARLAQMWLDEAGIAPQEVSLRVLVPLLEYSSLESETEESLDVEGTRAMHKRWAALLANAAAGDRGAKVAPGFPRILAELEPIEARILEVLASGRHWIDVVRLPRLLEINRNEVDPLPTLRVHVDNLERLQLCIVDRPNRKMAELIQMIRRERKEAGRSLESTSRVPNVPTRTTIEISALGRAFIAACTPPRRRARKEA